MGQSAGRGVGRRVGLVAVSAGVLAVLVLGTVAGAPSVRRAGALHVAPPETRSQAALFSCPSEAPVFTRHAPPIREIQEERARAHAVEQATGPDWKVVFARPTRLGVFAFVDGDLRAARPVLEALGATHVYQRDLGPEFGEGHDEDALVDQAMQWALEKPMQDVRRALRGLPKDGELAYWNEAGAIFVQWKTPLPQQVAALAETHVDGALVVVDETPYSPREIHAGVDRIFAAARAGKVAAELSSGGTCGNLSGALIGVTPATIGDAGRLQEQLAGIAGMPVHVVPEEYAHPL